MRSSRLLSMSTLTNTSRVRLLSASTRPFTTRISRLTAPYRTLLNGAEALTERHRSLAVRVRVRNLALKVLAPVARPVVLLVLLLSSRSSCLCRTKAVSTPRCGTFEPHIMVQRDCIAEGCYWKACACLLCCKGSHRMAMVVRSA